jgi:hypothetical protein
MQRWIWIALVSPLAVAKSDNTCLPAGSGLTLMSTAECDNSCIDSCGVCNGDGSGCQTMSLVMLVIVLLLCFAILVMWGKFLRTQVLYDSQVKTAERSIVEGGT